MADTRIGIEIKTSILLVAFTHQLREQGMGLDEAIRRAGEIRFVPIVLTTLTEIGGLLPLALEARRCIPRWRGSSSGGWSAPPCWRAW